MLNLPVVASLVLLITAVVHSVLGEVLIFRKLSGGRIVPSLAAPPLEPRNVRILWATWHLASVFGLVLALVVYRVGAGEPLGITVLLRTIAVACALGAGLVLVGTRGRHPGWVSLSIAAALIWYAT
jgi:hypothetical protein